MVDSIGFFKLYGLLVGLGIYVGAWISARIAEREKIDPEIVWDSLVWVVVFGLIGARAYHVVDLWSYYRAFPSEILAVWNGGIGIYGGLFGGFIGLNVWIYSIFFSNQKENYKLQITNFNKELLKILDLAAFGIPVGQAIGRWGNYFNQELYGRPTNLPWKIFIDPERRVRGFESYDYFHPLFLYESVLSLVLFCLLLMAYSSKFTLSANSGQAVKNSKLEFKVGGGRFVGMYAVGYGLIRLILEPLRVGNWVIGDVATATIFSVAMIFIGVLLIFRRNKSEKRRS